jgi:hypothetical protein
MSFRIYNRISRKVIQGIPQDPVLGLFRLVSCGPNLLQNNILARDGDFLIPDSRGEWNLHEKGKGAIAQLQISKHESPDDADRIRAVGELLLKSIRTGSTINEWTDTSPLMPKITEQMELAPLDKAILRHLPHLEEVCRRPREHLHIEIDRVWLSQSRRMPHDAPNYLAAHTEDWEKRTVRAVYPKRILSTTRILDIDIYENRVAARLIDHLLIHLNQRISSLYDILGMFQELETNQDEKGWHFKVRRLYSMWGADFDASNGRQKTQATLRKLESFRHRLLGLMDSRLYKGVPRSAQVEFNLKTTNVLINDQHYRQVAQLWLDWQKWAPRRAVSPEEKYAQAQLLCGSFDAFCLLLVFRALRQLSFQPASVSQKVTKGAAIDFNSTVEGRVSLLWRDDGVISISPSHVGLKLVYAMDLDCSTPATFVVSARAAAWFGPRRPPVVVPAMKSTWHRPGVAWRTRLTAPKNLVLTSLPSSCRGHRKERNGNQGRPWMRPGECFALLQFLNPNLKTES